MRPPSQASDWSVTCSFVFCICGRLVTMPTSVPARSARTSACSRSRRLGRHIMSFLQDVALHVCLPACMAAWPLRLLCALALERFCSLRAPQLLRRQVVSARINTLSRTCADCLAWLIQRSLCRSGSRSSTLLLPSGDCHGQSRATFTRAWVTWRCGAAEGVGHTRARAAPASGYLRGNCAYQENRGGCQQQLWGDSEADAGSAGSSQELGCGCGGFFQTLRRPSKTS